MVGVASRSLRPLDRAAWRTGLSGTLPETSREPPLPSHLPVHICPSWPLSYYEGPSPESPEVSGGGRTVERSGNFWLQCYLHSLLTFPGDSYPRKMIHHEPPFSRFQTLASCSRNLLLSRCRVITTPRCSSHPAAEA